MWGAITVEKILEGLSLAAGSLGQDWDTKTSLFFPSF